MNIEHTRYGYIYHDNGKNIYICLVELDNNKELYDCIKTHLTIRKIKTLLNTKWRDAILGIFNSILMA